MQRLMRQCWDHDPHQRPTMAEIKEWTKLPEFSSLRTVCQLPNGNFSAASHCVVTCNHIHGEDSVLNKIPSPTTILPGEEKDLFSSPITISSTKTSTILRKKGNKYSQVWIAQESESMDTSQLSIFVYKSDDLGYRVRHVYAMAFLASHTVPKYSGKCIFMC